MEDEIKISNDLQNLINSLNLLGFKSETLIMQGYSQEEIIISLLNQLAICNSYLVKKDIMDDYVMFSETLRKEFLDYQILLASYKERNNL